MILRILFPSSVGRVVSVIRSTFTSSPEAYATGVTVQQELPAAASRTKRMVAVVDNSGPDDGVQSRRRYGVNVYAESAVVAEQLALLAMAGLRVCADGVLVTLADEFSGPYPIQDDPAMVVANTNLAHYFFTFRLTVKGKDF
jgi:hypothetical protein